MSDLVLAKGPAAPDAPGALTLAFDSAAHAAALAKGGRASPWEDFIPAGEVVAIRDGSEAAASNWHRLGGEDFTSFEGVALGRPFRWLLWLTALPVFKLASALRAARAVAGPGRLIAQSNLEPELLAVARAFGTVELVPGLEGGPGIHHWSKPAPNVSAGKVLAGQALDLLSHGGAGRKPLLVSYYPTLDGVLDNLISSESPYRCFLADMPPRRHLPRLLANGGRVLFEARGAVRLNSPQSARVAEMKAAWRRAKTDPAFRARFAYAGLDLFEAIAPTIDDFVDTGLESLAGTCAYYARLWEKERPAGVLMAYNETPLVHLLADIARSRGTPAVTMQHGLPQGRRLQFAESNTSHFFVWGPEQKETFARTDSLKCDCRPVGNPNFDRYAAVAAASRAGRPSGPVRRMLLLSSPVSAVIELSGNLDAERHALGVLDALHSRPDVEVTLKIHPAESLDYYRGFLKGRPVEIVKDVPISDCLADADLVVGPFSTVLLEAMIAGKPVLCVNATRSPFPPPFDGNWGIPQLKPGDELRAALDGLFADPARRLPEITAAFPRILDAFVGPLDGKSVERVVAELGRLTNPG